jgi:hypothetical protein
MIMNRQESDNDNYDDCRRRRGSSSSILSFNSIKTLDLLQEDEKHTSAFETPVLDSHNNKSIKSTISKSGANDDEEDFDPFHPLVLSPGRFRDDESNGDDESEALLRLCGRRRSHLLNLVKAITLPESSNSTCSSSSTSDIEDEDDENNDDVKEYHIGFEGRVKVVGGENEGGQDANGVSQLVVHNGNAIDHRMMMSTSPSLQGNEPPPLNAAAVTTTLYGKYRIIDYNERQHNNDEEIIVMDRPKPYDVICGRNCAAHHSVGNRRFRLTIMMNLDRYVNAQRREEKTRIIKNVADMLMDDDVGARFLKKLGNNRYRPLNAKQIREKVGHCLRDLSAQNRIEKAKMDMMDNMMTMMN